MKKHKKLIFAFFIKSVCNVFFFFLLPSKKPDAAAMKCTRLPSRIAW